MLRITPVTHLSQKPLSRLLPYVFLILLSAVSVLLWYSNNSLAIGGDYVIAFNPATQISHYFSFWDFWKDLGNPIPPLLTGLPPFETLAFGALFELTGNFVLTYKMFLILLTVIQSFSTFYLVTAVFRRYSSRNLLGVIFSTISIYNPLSVQTGYFTIVEPLVGRAFLPLFLGLVVDGYYRRNYAFALLSGLCSIPMLESFPVGTWEIGLLSFSSVVLFVTYSFFFKKLSRVDLGFLGKYLGILVTSVGLANIHQIILAIATLGDFASVGTAFQPNFFFNNWATLWNVLRLMPLWGFYNGYVPYSAQYSQPVLVGLSLALPIIAFSSLLLTRSKTVIAIAGISVMAVLSSTATNPPAGQLYAYIVTNFFPLKVFYASVPIIQYALPLTLLMSASFTIAETYRRLGSARMKRLSTKKIVSYVVPLLLICVVISSAWPMITGEVMANWYPPSSDTRGAPIPSDYYNVRNLFSHASCTCWSLLLPQPSTYVGTAWGYQGTVLLYNSLFDNLLITGKSVSYSVGRSGVDAATSFAYQIPMRIVPEDNLTLLLGDPTGKAWTSYQGDAIMIDRNQTSPYSNSSIDWSLSGSGSQFFHEISYQLPSIQNITSKVLVLVQGNFDSSELQFGMGDTNGNIGWYSSGAIQSETPGWITYVANPTIPVSGNFDSRQVSTLYFRYFTGPATSVEIRVGAILMGNLAPDPISWARTLAALSIRFIILDSSMTLGNLTDSAVYQPSLQNQTAFEKIYSGGYLQVYQNRYSMSDLLFATSQIYVVNDFQDVTSLLTRIPPSKGQVSIFFHSDLSQEIMPLLKLTNSTTSYLMTGVSIHNGGVDASIDYSGPIMLVLNQAFDSSWNAYVNGSPLTTHVKVLGFANAWLANLNGPSRVSITYARQDFIDIAQASFVFGILTIILGLAVIRFRRVFATRLRHSKAATNRAVSEAVVDMRLENTSAHF